MFIIGSSPKVNPDPDANTLGADFLAIFARFCLFSEKKKKKKRNVFTKYNK